MNYTTYEELDMKKQISDMVMNTIFAQQVKNYSTGHPAIRKISSYAVLPLSDRSSRYQSKQKTLKQPIINSGNKNNEFTELNKKLLSDIHIFRKQVAEIKAQNENLIKIQKQNEQKYEELKQAHFQLGKKYDLLKKQINHYPAADIIMQIEENQKQILDTRKNINWNPQMIISRTTIQDDEFKLVEMETTIQNLKSINRRLENQIINLKVQLEKALKKENKQVDKIISTDQSTQTLLQENFVNDSSQEQLNSTKEKEAELQNKIDKLQNHIKQVQKRHSKLKDRCHTIRHLIAGSS